MRTETKLLMFLIIIYFFTSSSVFIPIYLKNPDLTLLLVYVLFNIIHMSIQLFGYYVCIVKGREKGGRLSK